jgi:predicted metal-dependent hydrolase
MPERVIDRIDALAGRIVGTIAGAITGAMTDAIRHTLKSTDRPVKLLRNRPPDPHQLALQLDLFAPADAAHESTPDTNAADLPPERGAMRPPSSALPSSPSSHPQQQSHDGPPHHATPHVPLAPPAPRTTPLPGSRRILLGQHALSYQLRRSKRRTIGFMIDDDGLRITAPKWVGIGEIESAIREKQRWILTKLHDQQERATRRLRPQMQWRDGGVLPYLGTDLTLLVVAAAGDAMVHDPVAGTLMVCLPAEPSEQQLKDRVQAWLQQEAKRLFAARLPVYAEKLDVQYRAFALSSATTQWGSCTADGKIRLNWRLMHFALPLIDYVIAHELSHLREMNHGPRFWATVQSVFPEFVAAKKALRDHAPETLPAF